MIEYAKCVDCGNYFPVERAVMGGCRKKKGFGRSVRVSSKYGVLYGNNSWLCNGCNEAFFSVIIKKMEKPIY